MHYILVSTWFINALLDADWICALTLLNCLTLFIRTITSAFPVAPVAESPCSSVLSSVDPVLLLTAKRLPDSSSSGFGKANHQLKHHMLLETQQLLLCIIPMAA